MADPSLRRSSRRAKKLTYSVGDLVEIVPKGETDASTTRGRLVARVTGESESKHRWLVGIDKESSLQQEMPEDNFGEILGQGESSLKASNVHQPTRNRKTINATVVPSNPRKARSNSKASSPTPSETPTGVSKEGETSPPLSHDETKTNKLNKKRVVFDDVVGNGAPGSDVSSSPVEDKRKAAKSAREQRSKRRQAQQGHPLGDFHHRTCKKIKMTSKQKESAIRIPMLTGTLFLYRGPHRRAEFIPKV